MSNFNLKVQMVIFAKQTSISETGHMYGTTRKTVRRWIKRYELYGLEGLKELKRAPKNIPHKLNKEAEERIIYLRKRHPAWRSVTVN